ACNAIAKPVNESNIDIQMHSDPVILISVLSSKPARTKDVLPKKRLAKKCRMSFWTKLSPAAYKEVKRDSIAILCKAQIGAIGKTILINAYTGHNGSRKRIAVLKEVLPIMSRSHECNGKIPILISNPTERNAPS